MLCTTIIAAVTMYAATGQPMANGVQPFVGAVACPRDVPLGTTAKIMDISFVCGDRTHKKYNGRFDLFSTGTKTQMLKFGKQTLPVTLCQ